MHRASIFGVLMAALITLPLALAQVPKEVIEVRMPDGSFRQGFIENGQFVFIPQPNVAEPEEVNGTPIPQEPLTLEQKYERATELAEAKEYQQAIPLLREAAEAGHAEAQAHLAKLYFTGEGVEKDPVKAIEWSRKAAEQGSPRGINNLGAAYSSGTGVQQDFTLAREWIEKAVALDFPEAYFNLGLMYYTGQGASLDLIKGIGLMQKADAMGSSHPKMYRQLYGPANYTDVLPIKRAS